MEKETKHFYLLPDGRTAGTQYEACTLLGTGRRAFRNAVKRGEITKCITNESRPNGYENNAPEQTL